MTDTKSCRECVHDVLDDYDEYCEPCITNDKRNWEEKDRDETETVSDYPCDTCNLADSCDGWEARFCCTLCHYYSDDPDCSNCDPMDI